MCRAEELATNESGTAAKCVLREHEACVELGDPERKTEVGRASLVDVTVM